MSPLLNNRIEFDIFDAENPCEPNNPNPSPKQKPWPNTNPNPNPDSDPDPGLGLNTNLNLTPNLNTNPKPNYNWNQNPNYWKCIGPCLKLLTPTRADNCFKTEAPNENKGVTFVDFSSLKRVMTCSRREKLGTLNRFLITQLQFRIMITKRKYHCL